MICHAAEKGAQEGGIWNWVATQQLGILRGSNRLNDFNSAFAGGADCVEKNSGGVKVKDAIRILLRCMSFRNSLTSSLAPVLNTCKPRRSFPVVFKSLSLSSDSVKNTVTSRNIQNYKTVNLTGCNGIFLGGDLSYSLSVPPVARTFGPRVMGIRRHGDSQ